MFPKRSRRGRGGTRKDIGLFVRSSWEANYARYLNFLQRNGDVISWSYEPKTFWFDKIKRGTRFYTPDFLVTWKNGTSEFHEVKGYMDQKSATKLRRMKQFYPDVTVQLIDKSRYQRLNKQLSGLIPGWEGR
jgi:hypothetical protein